LSINERYPDLKSSNAIVRERIANQIAEERDENTISQLIAVLDSPDYAYRQSLVQVFGIIGFDAIPALIEELDRNESDLVRVSCSHALAAIAKNNPEEDLPNEALEGLYQAVSDSNPVVQLSTIGALSTMGSAVYEILVQALNLDDLLVGVAAIDAIGSLGDSRGLTLLSELSANLTLDNYLRDAATSALSRLEQVIKFNS
jgi:bilin biosynthesis protein